MTNGMCDDCGRVIGIGEWPYDCGHKGHTLLSKLAFMPSGRTTDYAPPMPINPMDKPVVTRDWINPDGTVRAQKPDEWCRENAIYTEPGVNL